MSAIQDQIESVLATAEPDVEVLLAEVVSGSRVRLFIDHPQGVSLALCERVTKLLPDVREKYALEVSSPGPERPLRKPAHFRNVLGRRVAIRTAGEIGGRKRFRGELVAADDGAVTVQSGDNEFDIPYESIVRGNLIDEEGGR